MSHFSVAVFTDGKKSVEELLAPYDENIEVTPYVELTRQQMIEKALERKKDYEQRARSGKEIADWMKEYINANTDEELYQCEFDSDCSYDENGNQLSTYNPESKWDYWIVGGRWNGKLKAINGEHGEGGLFTPNPRKNGKYDIAKVADIDFSPNQDSYDTAIRWWEVVVEGAPLKENEDKKISTVSTKRSIYWKSTRTKRTMPHVNRYSVHLLLYCRTGNGTRKGKWDGLHAFLMKIMNGI